MGVWLEMLDPDEVGFADMKRFVRPTYHDPKKWEKSESSTRNLMQKVIEEKINEQQEILNSAKIFSSYRVKKMLRAALRKTGNVVATGINVVANKWKDRTERI